MAETERQAEASKVSWWEKDVLRSPYWRPLPGKPVVLSQSTAGCVIGRGHSVVSFKLEVKTKVREAVSC